MKHLILTAVLVSGLTLLAASGTKAQQDSLKRKKFDINYGLGVTIGEKRDSTGKIDQSKGRFVGGITFTRFDIGFSRLIDNGSFSLSPANDFLAYKGAKTSTVSFDVLQFGYRFNSNFKIYVAGGFDWTMIRLKKDITIQSNTPDLTYINEPIMFSKNRFSSSYVHIPLNFELRTKENRNGNRFYVVFGPEVGFLLNGKVKQISDERGKQKFKDDYNFAPFRYGGTFRVGFNSLALFAKYYANDMFDSAPQKGLKNMSFGITLGLN
ncbi:outer membrane beta-barrel protein [Pedobacter sp. UC225_65]|uniref:outer membrane beta-barrel protein n=1 Tax=Pedobacter sp. UC225_65 TaxID=3350173 RepID=UPI00366FB651